MASKIVTVVGARPQFIKASTVSRAIGASGRLVEVLVHTGQHFDADMSGVFFEELEMPAPQHNLNIHGGSHGEMTGRMLAGIEAILAVEKPEWVLVYGDTNSTLAGALAAAKLHVPVIHVEAGLRSFNRRMPEEINRVVADHLATLHFCPTRTAVENLRKEGIVDNVFHVGDVMFDATLFAAQRAEQTSNILHTLELRPQGYSLATVHRAENTDQPHALRAVFDYLSVRAREVPIVLPLHPRTRNAAAAQGIVLTPFIVCEPVGYFDMCQLLANANVVYTDSGGVQKEAYFHRVPCITLRSETEWIETITHGWNRLWQGPDFVGPRSDIADYGDGSAARRIVELIP